MLMEAYLRRRLLSPVAESINNTEVHLRLDFSVPRALPRRVSRILSAIFFQTLQQFLRTVVEITVCSPTVREVLFISGLTNVRGPKGLDGIILQGTIKFTELESKQPLTYTFDLSRNTPYFVLLNLLVVSKSLKLEKSKR